MKFYFVAVVILCLFGMKLGQVARAQVESSQARQAEQVAKALAAVE